jgi:hypothetical protein
MERITHATYHTTIRWVATNGSDSVDITAPIFAENGYTQIIIMNVILLIIIIIIIIMPTNWNVSGRKLQPYVSIAYPSLAVRLAPLHKGRYRLDTLFLVQVCLGS